MIYTDIGLVLGHGDHDAGDFVYLWAKETFGWPPWDEVTAKTDHLEDDAHRLYEALIDDAEDRWASEYWHSHARKLGECTDGMMLTIDLYKDEVLGCPEQPPRAWRRIVPGVPGTYGNGRPLNRYEED